jgi:hypothetical protein
MNWWLNCPVNFRIWSFSIINRPEAVKFHSCHQYLENIATQLTPSSWVDFEKPTSAQLLRNFLHTLCNPSVHYLVDKNPPLFPIPSKMIKIHTPHPISLFRSFKWFSSFRLPCLHEIIYWPMRAICSAHIILIHFIIMIIFGKEYKLLSSTLCIFSSFLLFHPSVVQISSATYWQTPSVYILPLMIEAKFHIHTKLQAKLQFAYFNPCVLRQQARRQRGLSRVVNYRHSW